MRVVRGDPRTRIPVAAVHGLEQPPAVDAGRSPEDFLGVLVEGPRSVAAAADGLASVVRVADGAVPSPTMRTAGPMPPLLLVSSMFPPMHGGLPDHTDRLAHALQEHFQVAVLTTPGVEMNRPFPVLAVVPDWHDAAGLVTFIERAAPEGPLLWQYVPHMYGRGGVNLAIPRVMGRLARKGRRQVVIAHEIAAPFSWWPHRSGYALAHRWMWRGVRSSADAIGMSTAGWFDRFRTGTGSDSRFFLAPSPSNLPRIDVGPEHRREWRQSLGLPEDGLVVGFFGSVGTGKQFDWVLAAWRAIRRTSKSAALAVIGGKPAPELTPDEAAHFRPLGFLDAPSASRALSALDLLVLPFEDGIAERRSSFMAGLAHGLAVVTTTGPSTGSELRDGDFYVGVPVTEGPERFAAVTAALASERSRRRGIAERARARYAERYDWPRLAASLARRLRE